MPEVLNRIEAARARGIDVAASVYPYTRASNGLTAMFPQLDIRRRHGQDAGAVKDPDQRCSRPKGNGRAKCHLGKRVARLRRWCGVTLIQVVNHCATQVRSNELR